TIEWLVFGNYRGKIADKFETGRAFLRQRFGCSSTSSRRNPKRSRTTVEQHSNNTRTRVEHESNSCRTSVEEHSKKTKRVLCFYFLLIAPRYPSKKSDFEMSK